FTNANTCAYKDYQDAAFWFRGLPEYAKILKEGSVEVVNIANNHTHDYMSQGYDDTLENLTKEEIHYFGYDNVLIKDVKGIKIGLLGFNELGINEVGTNSIDFKREVKKSIEDIKDNVDLIIVSFHWGEENTILPNYNQISLARTAVDAGADLILGHHSHVIQGIENYKGKHIIYSLGNFVYGGKYSLTDDGHSFIYQEKFTFNNGNLTNNSPKIIPVRISTDPDKNDFRPILLQAEEENEAREKLLSRSIGLKYLANKMSITDIHTIIEARDKMYENKNIEIDIPNIVKNNMSNDKDLVNLNDFIPDLKIDCAYAKSDNFTGKKLYYNNMPYLRLGTAEKLKVANEKAKEYGYRLKVWDAYRPPEIQWLMWNIWPDPNYIASPLKNYSHHNRGIAVDVTLIDDDGKELPMPSKFDDFSAKANRNYAFATNEEKNNSLLLEKIMYESGFQGIQSEWWHFVDTDYSQYNIIDIEKIHFGKMLGIVP
ncbi:MAG TPA: hypothetical protein GX526_07080, partial [Thermoanaerobacterales bacterium]|nr:hypothetical protein [Thermoanaerobacterales bacterium]